MKHAKQILSILMAVLMIALSVPLVGATDDNEEGITEEQRALLNTSAYVNLSEDGVLKILKEGIIEDELINAGLSKFCIDRDTVKSVIITPNVQVNMDAVEQLLVTSAAINHLEEINSLADWFKLLSSTSFFFYCHFLLNTPIQNNNILMRKDGNGVSVTETDLYAASIDNEEATEASIPNGIKVLHAIAFSKYVEVVKLPSSIIKINPASFENAASLKTIIFSGTEEQWNAIEIGEYNDQLLNATIHFTGDAPHTHTWDTGTITPATCVTPERTTYHCTSADCDEVKVVETAGINPNNHGQLNANGDCTLCGIHVKDVEQPANPTENDSASGEAAPKLNFFQRIIQWFRNLFAKLRFWEKR